MKKFHDIKKLQAMDEGAWGQLQDDFYRRIYFFVSRYLQDHQNAEDVTQDVFLGAVRGIANFDTSYTLDQFLFGIAKNRVIDIYRKRKIPLISPKKDDNGDGSMMWLENIPSQDDRSPDLAVVDQENIARQRRVLAKILKEYVGDLWQEEDFSKLMILEYLFVIGGRNNEAARRFDIEDEKTVAGIKFRAIEKLRGLARQNDPNHSLFGGLWKPGAR